MNAYNVAQELIAYLASSRRAGHTTAAIKVAAETPDAILVAHNFDAARNIKQMALPQEISTTTLTEIDNASLRGHQGIILMDNASLQFLLGDLVGTIAALRKSNQEQADKIRLAKAILQ